MKSWKHCPTRRWMSQVGRLDENGPEKQAHSSSKTQTLCLSVGSIWLSNLATQAHKRNFHHRLARTLTVPQCSPSHWQQGWAPPRSMGWSKLDLGSSQPPFELLGALAMPDVDSAPEQQIHPRDISNTRRLSWHWCHGNHILLLVNDSGTRKRSVWWVPPWASRGKFTLVFWHHLLQPHLRGATEQRLREKPCPSDDLHVMVIEAGHTRPRLWQQLCPGGVIKQGFGGQ